MSRFRLKKLLKISAKIGEAHVLMYDDDKLSSYNTTLLKLMNAVQDEIYEETKKGNKE